MKLVSICRKSSEDFISAVIFHEYACWGGMTSDLSFWTWLWPCGSCDTKNCLHQEYTWTLSP